MTGFNSRLLVPPQQEQESIPFHRPWRSIVLEAAVLLFFAIGLYLGTHFLGFSINNPFRTIISLILALIPLGLWMYLSWLPERNVAQPRQRLLAVVLLTAILTNAVGIPVINDIFQVEGWLPLSSALDRIVGYTFTVGIVQEFLKYLIVRYTVWPQYFRVRSDGVAYGVASGIGYVTILNLHFALTNNPTPDVAGLRYFFTFAVQIVTSIIVGYGLSELRFGTPSPILLPVMIALAALITGIAIPIHAGLANATFSLGVSAPRPLFALGFAVVVFICITSVLYFVYESAERRAREVATDEDFVQ